MFEGSCLCKSVKYSVACDPQPMGHCHCHTCRKSHSAAFSTVMSVPKSVFKWEHGENYLSQYQSSPGKTRFFCKNCGSQLIASRETTDYVIIRVGSIDTEISKRPQVHFWCSEGALWYDPDIKLPLLPEGVP